MTRTPPGSRPHRLPYLTVRLQLQTMRLYSCAGYTNSLLGYPVCNLMRGQRCPPEGVTQETHLFHDSIKNNLRIAKPDATNKEIEAACKKASVHDFIPAPPKGYDSPAGERGTPLPVGTAAAGVGKSLSP